MAAMVDGSGAWKSRLAIEELSARGNWAACSGRWKLEPCASAPSSLEHVIVYRVGSTPEPC